MIAIEIRGAAPNGTILITRHYTPEGVLGEYAIRQAQGQTDIHKQTVVLPPWSPETCTHHPKHRPGGNHAS